MRSVSIIGIGRVGGALSISLPEHKYHVETLVTREMVPENMPDEAVSVRFDALESLSSDIVFITTRDGEIESAANVLAGKLRSGAVVFHTSGSQPSSILSSLSGAGCKIGSIHPLVSISAAKLGPERFRDSYFCIEGDPEAVTLGEQIVADLGGRPFTIDTRFKVLYHASAVTACGHLVALFDAAIEMMTQAGLSADHSKEILLPLVSSTIQNLGEQSTARALTGTFARADADTFTKHIAALNLYGTDELLEIYLLLGERSLELAAKQGVSPDRIETLRTKVAIAKSKLKW